MRMLVEFSLGVYLWKCMGGIGYWAQLFLLAHRESNISKLCIKKRTNYLNYQNLDYKKLVVRLP